MSERIQANEPVSHFQTNNPLPIKHPKKTKKGFQIQRKIKGWMQPALHWMQFYLPGVPALKKHPKTGSAESPASKRELVKISTPSALVASTNDKFNSDQALSPTPNQGKVAKAEQPKETGLTSFARLYGIKDLALDSKYGAHASHSDETTISSASSPSGTSKGTSSIDQSRRTAVFGGSSERASSTQASKASYGRTDTAVFGEASTVYRPTGTAVFGGVSTTSIEDARSTPIRKGTAGFGCSDAGIFETTGEVSLSNPQSSAEHADPILRMSRLASQESGGSGQTPELFRFDSSISSEDLFGLNSSTDLKLDFSDLSLKATSSALSQKIPNLTGSISSFASDLSEAGEDVALSEEIYSPYGQTAYLNYCAAEYTRLKRALQEKDAQAVQEGRRLLQNLASLRPAIFLSAAFSKDGESSGTLRQLMATRCPSGKLPTQETLYLMQESLRSPEYEECRNQLLEYARHMNSRGKKYAAMQLLLKGEAKEATSLHAQLHKLQLNRTELKKTVHKVFEELVNQDKKSSGEEGFSPAGKKPVGMTFTQSCLKYEDDLDSGGVEKMLPHDPLEILNKLNQFENQALEIGMIEREYYADLAAINRAEKLRRQDLGDLLLEVKIFQEELFKTYPTPLQTDDPELNQRCAEQFEKLFFPQKNFHLLATLLQRAMKDRSHPLVSWINERFERSLTDGRVVQQLRFARSPVNADTIFAETFSNPHVFRKWLSTLTSDGPVGLETRDRLNWLHNTSSSPRLKEFTEAVLRQVVHHEKGDKGKDWFQLLSQLSRGDWIQLQEALPTDPQFVREFYCRGAAVKGGLHPLALYWFNDIENRNNSAIYSFQSQLKAIPDFERIAKIMLFDYAELASSTKQLSA